MRRLAIPALLVILLSSVAPASPSAGATPAAVTGLTTESADRPLGIDEPAPRLGWRLRAGRPGTLQTAYHVLVASTVDKLAEGRADVWDSGRVASGASVQIPYAGGPLAARTRYHWTVRVWDERGQASGWAEPRWFETGLLTQQDWTARWISHDAPTLLPTEHTAKQDPAETPANGTLGQTFTADRPFVAVSGSFPTWHTTDSDVTLTLYRDGPGGQRVATRRLDDHADNGWGELPLAEAAPAGRYYLEQSQPRGKVGWWSHPADGYPHGQAFAGGEPVAGDRTIRWTPAPEVPDHRTSLLRKDFTLDRPVERARLYTSALGVSEPEINGHRVSADRFAPGWTDYATRVQYRTYDVTALLREGGNALGAALSTGWYAGSIASAGQNLYGSSPGLLAQLEVVHPGGATTRIGTDESWRSTVGPIRTADFQHGETHDARAELTGWSSPGFDAGDWTPARPKTDVTARLVAQADPPVRAVAELPAKAVTSPAPGVSIVDLGQNMVGTARLRLRGAAPGTRVTLRFGEVLNPDGTLYTANLRGAKATDHYLARGGAEEVWEPRFTFHGFRYVEVTGHPGPLPADAVTGVVLTSDTPATGTFRTSDPMLNRLQDNIVWSQRGNFLSVPTDCPQRDERLGWTGDINVFAPTAAFNADVSAFLGDKWMRDLRDAQRPDGAVTDVVPYVPIVGAGNAGWGDAVVTLPHTLWRTYGDTRVVERSYPAIVRWLDYLRASSTGFIRPDAGYGDWLNLGDPAPRDLVGTAYFAHVAGLAAELAEAIGKPADAAAHRELRDRVRAAFQATYLEPDGKLRGDAQAGYVLALAFDLLPADRRAAAAGHLVRKLESRNWHLSTGFLGTPDLLRVLSDTGHLDVAYRLLTQRSFPSWGYEVDRGATTIWERWDSIKPDGTFGDPAMNSFNHYAYGAVGNWMYRTVSGISLDAPARHVDIRPRPGGGLTAAEASFESVYGTVASSWRQAGPVLTLAVTVPPNTTATIHVPAPDRESVRVLGRGGARFQEMRDGFAVFTAGSGELRFRVG
ncbi:alpha-L-rhamnosidase [Amycolatopsis suaedae]|uniref:alpha-L-rhamnosidase n=1 Tax=Amycolatopsis suaedae TaxID=2510978 RepID=A0A4Q7IX08_9PSEU|nr:alpha-L-rhamnosidase [Amycolatopsis suaedae]RZQ59471.1 rhamnosidase [Amycolatopsis suaedae]